MKTTVNERIELECEVSEEGAQVKWYDYTKYILYLLYTTVIYILFVGHLPLDCHRVH